MEVGSIGSRRLGFYRSIIMPKKNRRTIIPSKELQELFPASYF